MTWSHLVLQVRTYVWAREEYKNAAATLTNERFEGPHKQNVESLMTDTAQQASDHHMATMHSTRPVRLRQLLTSLLQWFVLPVPMHICLCIGSQSSR